jgi:hypothetical protein
MSQLRKKSGKQSYSKYFQKIIYLGISLAKEVNNLYKESYKSLKKEIKEDIRRRIDLPCS